MEEGKLLLYILDPCFTTMCFIILQVKTWFANARRRIHKGGDLIPAKHGGSNSYLMREHHDDNDLISHNEANGICGNASLPSDPVSSRNLGLKHLTKS